MTIITHCEQPKTGLNKLIFRQAENRLKNKGGNLLSYEDSGHTFMLRAFRDPFQLKNSGYF